MRHFFAISLALFVSCTTSSVASASNFGQSLFEDSRTYLYAHQDVEVFGNTTVVGAIPHPSGIPGLDTVGFASISGNDNGGASIAMTLETQTGFNTLQAAVVDHYLLSAPGRDGETELLSGSMHITGGGHSVNNTGTDYYIGGTNVDGYVGTGITETASVSGILDSFHWEVGSHDKGGVLAYIITNGLIEFDIEVILGQEFDIAFGARILNSNAFSVDLGSTISVSFDPPAGTELISAHGFGASTIVPEPSTLLLASLAGCALLHRRRPR